jgi:hypothetical protein
VLGDLAKALSQRLPSPSDPAAWLDHMLTTLTSAVEEPAELLSGFPDLEERAQREGGGEGGNGGGRFGELARRTLRTLLQGGVLGGGYAALGHLGYTFARGGKGVRGIAVGCQGWVVHTTAMPQSQRRLLPSATTTHPLPCLTTTTTTDATSLRVALSLTSTAVGPLKRKTGVASWALQACSREVRAHQSGGTDVGH